MLKKRPALGLICPFSNLDIYDFVLLILRASSDWVIPADLRAEYRI